jgi:hypothetical protein
MKVLGLILGFVAFLFVEVVCGEFATHNAHTGDFPGLVAWIWVAWPFFHAGDIRRFNFLHPAAKEYDKKCADVFAQLHQMLRETVYRFGDRWHVITADTEANRLVADLQYVDEEFSINSGFKPAAEKVKRFLRMTVLFKDAVGGKTVAQFEFEPRGEGMSGDYACDEVIKEVLKGFEGAIGKGTPLAGELPIKLPAPPWWLLGLTGWMVLSFAGDVLKNMRSGS